MEVVAEVVLSVSLELLLKKLASSDLWKYAREQKIEVHLNTWKRNLKKINKVLDDAEEKQISKPSVRAWLADLRNLAYDVDDLLDEFNYEMTSKELSMMAAGGGAEKDDAGTSSSKVRKFFMMPSCCNNFSPLQAKRNVEMGRKMEEITRRLEGISGQEGDLGLKKLKQVIQGTRAASDQRPNPPPLAHEAWVFGRDEDKKKIVAMLLNSPHDDDEQQQQGPNSNSNPNPNLSIVSIVAMGGMGKTTLADLVYIDAQISEHFSPKAWVCVSDQFDLETVTRQILSRIDPSKKDLQSLRHVQDELRNQLKGKRFLIVLDDVWNEDYEQWDILRSPLLNGAPGSKILVTTRNTKVATTMGAEEGLYELNRLCDSDCWSLFQKHAFENRNGDERQTLEPIGREIIKKCGGSPLAARALGGLLRRENLESEWRRILNNKIWNLRANECNILPALRLSYTHLPSYLKRCFAYCAIFPQDYEFNKEQLIHLWMAEGLIQPASNDDEKEMEDVGNDYFDELFSRSFFQLSSSSNRSRYMMHDLVNDLANSIARDTCLHLDDKLKNDLRICPISETIRHSSITLDKYGTFDKFEGFCNKENLRTFVTLPIGASNAFPEFISRKVVLELIPRMRHLRVLSLNGYYTSEIPDSFGELKHLRYLNLSHTWITSLPNSIGNLYNLQTLTLSHCYYLTKLPISLGSLVSLRCLDVRGSYKLEEIPAQISKLKHLRILSKLVVGGSNNNLSIEDLRSMPPLRGKLCITILENVRSIQDAREGGLKSKHNLESLIIQWKSKSNGEAESDDDGGHSVESVLAFLEPNADLRKLRVLSYNAPRFPRWVNDIAKFDKMVKLSLLNCRKCKSLPCLGMLPSLQCLSIHGMDGVKVVGPEFYGCGGTSTSPFKALESLWFEDMPNWEDWSSSSSSSTQSSFPRLHQLTITYCPKLIKKLPSYLPSLTKLSIECSPKLVSPLFGLPSLNELEVKECNVEVLTSTGSDLTSLTTLKISGISGLIDLQGGFVGFLRAVQYLEFSRCQEMISLWEDGRFGIGSGSGSGEGHQPPLHKPVEMGLGCNLKSLEICNCERLERLPNGWQSLTCLEQLRISECPELVSFPNHGFPPMLRDVTLKMCEGLKHLPDGMMITSRLPNNSSRLECLTISDCPSLTCFPEGQFPTTFMKLILDSCEKLNSLPDGMMIGGTGGISCSLQHLELRSCGSLTCFPPGTLPTSLKQLVITCCEKLESLPEGIMQKHHQQHSIDPALEILKLKGCSSLKSFPKGSFPSTLRQLELVENPQLESISGEIMFHHNCSLQRLSICDDPNLTTLPAESLYHLTSLVISGCEKLEFEHNQFKNLTRLTSLKIYDCGSIKRPLSQWGLAYLPSLQSLDIRGISHSFPDTDLHQCYSNNSPLLPPTLTSLEISSFDKLESMASLSLQALTSLRSLNIRDCPKLRWIYPRGGVAPNTLATLYILGCPLLVEHYSRGKGKYWPQIAHIPCVLI